MRVIVETGKGFVLVLCALILLGLGASRIRYEMAQSSLSEVRKALRTELYKDSKSQNLTRLRKDELGIMDRETARIKLIRTDLPQKIRIKSITSRGGITGEVLFKIEFTAKGAFAEQERQFIHYRASCPLFSKCQTPVLKPTSSLYYTLALWR